MDKNNANQPKKSLKKKIVIGIAIVVGLILVSFLTYVILLVVVTGDLEDFGARLEISGGRIYFTTEPKCGPGEKSSCGILPNEVKCICIPEDSDPIVAKPIIYLYPETETELTLKLGRPENLTTVYPKYDDGWQVTAWPDGQLKDQKSGKELYSLYWEGKNDKLDVKMDSGFVVKGEETAEFLEEKLAYLGLNYREAEEFIVYWLPKLQKNPYNFIYFMTDEEIENEMPIWVSKEPETKIRVRMVFKGLDEPINVPEEELDKAPERKGFTLVEWGGVDLDNV